MRIGIQAIPDTAVLHSSLGVVLQLGRQNRLKVYVYHDKGLRIVKKTSYYHFCRGWEPLGCTGKSEMVDLENTTYSFYVLQSSLEAEHDFVAMQLL